MKIDFTKMSGAGNDFIVIDNRSQIIKDGTSFAKKNCDRHWGIGADGLLLVERSEIAPYRMMYYNADGSYGGMCGNGGRCISMFAYKKKIAPQQHQFEALNHIYSAIVNSEEVSLTMKNPSSVQLNKSMQIRGKRIRYSLIDTGSPHIVIDADEFIRNKNFDDLDVQRWGSLLRWNKKFSPAGTNVNFIRKMSDNKIFLRTYERGVEAETLACGTGSIASAVISSYKWKLNPPITIVPTSKISLTISFEKKDELIHNVILKGPAIITFTGTIDA